MTILSAQTIRKLNIMNPCHERTKAFGMSYGLSSAGYDLTLSLPDFPRRTLTPNEFMLVVAHEHFTMPNDVIGVVHDKSTWARKGLTVQNTVIEPNWRGYLTLEISNHSGNSIYLEDGMPIAQVVFHRLDEPTEQPYEGKYQNQAKIATVAIMET